MIGEWVIGFGDLEFENVASPGAKRGRGYCGHDAETTDIEIATTSAAGPHGSQNDTGYGLNG